MSLMHLIEQWRIKSRTQGLAYVCLALLTLSASAPSASDSQPPFTYGPTVEKTFTVTSDYRYLEAVYTPPVLLKARDLEPKLHTSAEDVLASQAGASIAKDREWFLRTWDPVSQQKLRDEMAGPQGPSPAFENWNQKILNHSIILTRWILTGNYVILGYRLIGPASTEKQKTTEFSTVFKLSETGWRATMELQSDPLLLHYPENKKVIEKVVK